MYWEHADQIVEINDACAALCGQYERPGHWDGDKLQTVAGTLRYLAFSRDLVRIHFDGDGREQMAAFVRAAAEALAIKVECVEAADAEVDLHIDLLSRAAPVPLGRLEAFARRLSVGGICFFSHWDDVQREDSLLSRARLRELLWRYGALPLFESYYAGFEKLDLSTFGAQNRVRALRPAIPEGDSQRICFVIGHARSGTSVLSQMLNDQPDIFIGYEANSYLVKNRHEFVANFNARAERLGRKKAKGFIMPRAAAEDSVATAYETLLRHYRLVGEKLAFAPRLSEGHAHHADLAFDYHCAYFPFARYLLVARPPRASVAAMARIFPGFNADQFLDTWIASLDALLRYALNFPTVRFISFERLLGGELGAVSALVGAEIKPGLLQMSEVTTGQALVADYWRSHASDHVSALAEQAEALYARFCALFDETGAWSKDTTHGVIDSELEGIGALKNAMRMNSD